MNIKNIIFDLGGVILNIDFKLMYAAFQRLGAQNMEMIYTQRTQSDLIDCFEIGKINAAEFRIQLQQAFGVALSHQEFDQAWNAILLDLPQNRIEVIKSLKHEHNIKTFLLSNTNEIHLKAIHAEHGTALFKACFDKEYYSHEVGKHKPDPAIFLQILEENGLHANETLFLDDTIRHVEAAAKLGMHAKLISPKLTLLDIPKLINIRI